MFGHPAIVAKGRASAGPANRRPQRAGWALRARIHWRWMRGITPGYGSSHLSDPGKEARSRAGIPVVPVFDGYRAYAILGIVMLHLIQLSGVVVPGETGLLAYLVRGTLGHAIDVLFVVSGFVVFLPTVARGGDFGRIGAYAIRRAARLLPAYWAITVLTLLLLAFVQRPELPGLPDATSTVLHFLGLQTPASMFVSEIPMGFGVNGPVWALSLEIGFYIVLPFIAAVYFRHPLAGLAVAALITVGWNAAFENIFSVADFLGIGLSDLDGLRLAVASTLQLPSWAFSFGLGMTGAWAYVRVSERAAQPSARLIGTIQILSLLALVFFVWLAGRYSTDAAIELAAQAARKSPEVAIGYSASLAVLMVSTALGARRLQAPFAADRVRELGDISYGIYLSHFLMAIYFGSLLSLPTNGTVQSLLIWTAAVVPASVLYGYVSARYLEQPIRRWARQYGAGRAP